MVSVLIIYKIDQLLNFNTTMSTCLRCNLTQKKKPVKIWKWRTTDVERFECKCGKRFNLYILKEKPAQKGDKDKKTK